MIYDEFMDNECVSICDAINSIKGVETIESCCGHNKRPFRIWLKSENSRQLFPIIRSIAPSYCGFDSKWKLEVSYTDVDNFPIIFYLHSNTIKGKICYDQSLLISNNILEFIANKKIMDYYHINQ